MNATDKAACLAHFRTVLDEERAQALLDHRLKHKKSTLTVYAAKLLAGKIGQCSDPAAATDEMILRGWVAVKPEWLEQKKPSQAYRTNLASAQADIEDMLFGRQDYAEPAGYIKH